MWENSAARAAHVADLQSEVIEMRRVFVRSTPTLVLALLVLPTSGARAEFVYDTETFNGGTFRLTFDTFDESLGTLIGVSLQGSVTTDYIYTRAANGRFDVFARFDVYDLWQFTVGGAPFATLRGGGISPFTHFAPNEVKDFGVTNVQDHLDTVFGLSDYLDYKERGIIQGDAFTVTRERWFTHFHVSPALFVSSYTDRPMRRGVHGTFTLTYEFDPVPEPASLTLVCTGAFACLAWGWATTRRARAANRLLSPS
jgi:hypothetical protein